MLRAWDEEPHVQFSDPKANDGSGWDWDDEIEAGLAGFWHFVAESNGTPIGFVQVIDPTIEPTKYWGDMPSGHRAIDIWIGPAEHLGKGFGTVMMEQALTFCFESEDVHTILIDPIVENTRAHRFYQRCGFKPVEERLFGDDLCLVHELNRADWRTGD